MTWGSEWGFLWGGDVELFDFDAFGKSKLWKQLDYAEKIRAYVEFLALAAALVDADNASLLARVGIDGAVGDELDDWGARIGAVRNGMSDSLYRRVIKAEARKKTGQADPATIYDIVEIYSDTARITLVEGVANWVIWIHFLTLEEQKQVGALLENTPGLGIGAQAVVVDPAGVFQWASTQASVTVTKHWTSTTGSVPSSESAGFASVVVIQ